MLTDRWAARRLDLNIGRTSGDVSGTDRENSNINEGTLLRVRVPPSAPLPRLASGTHKPPRPPVTVGEGDAAGAAP